MRIEETDTVADALVKVAEGNIGAATAIGRLLGAADAVDPMAFPYFPIFMLDSAGVYGSAVHVLFKDVCQKEPWRMLLLLRAYQLGIVTSKELQGWSVRDIVADEHAHPHWPQLVQRVTHELPTFRVPDLHREPAAEAD